MNPLSQPLPPRPSAAKFDNAGNIFNQIVGAVNTGLGVFQTLGGGGGGGGSGGAQCSRTMVSCLDQLIGEYQGAYRAIVARGGGAGELIALIQATLAALANPQIFPQGNADPYYNNTVSQLNAKIAELQGGGSTGMPSGGGAGGGTAATGGASSPGISQNFVPGIPNSYLLGGAAVAIVGGWYLSKR